MRAPRGELSRRVPVPPLVSPPLGAHLDHRDTGEIAPVVEGVHPGHRDAFTLRVLPHLDTYGVQDLLGQFDRVALEPVPERRRGVVLDGRQPTVVITAAAGVRHGLALQGPRRCTTALPYGRPITEVLRQEHRPVIRVALRLAG